MASAAVALGANAAENTTHFPDRTTDPVLSPEAIEIVYELEHVPANIDIDEKTGIVYFTYHPAAKHLYNELYPLSEGCRIAAIDKTKAQGVRDRRALYAFPDDEIQATMGDVHSIRIDSKKRFLYALDHGDGHAGTVRAPRLFKIHLDKNRIEETYEFEHEDTGHFSHFGEMSLSKDGRHIWIADRGSEHGDASLVIFDTNQWRAWRAFSGHHVTSKKDHTPRINGVDLDLPIHMGVDSIDESPDGEYLYFASAMDQTLWRVATKRLRDPAHYQSWALPDMEPHEHPEPIYNKTASDGLVIDKFGNIFMADFEHSAISVIMTEKPKKWWTKKSVPLGRLGNVTTLVRDDEFLRWPNGLALAEMNHQEYLYITCSVSHELDVRDEFKDVDHVEANGPFHIVRIRLFPHPKAMPKKQRRRASRAAEELFPAKDEL